MSRKLPEGTLLKIEFEFRLPIEASEHDIEEWLPFAFLGRCDCSADNPLMGQSPEAWANSFDWEDTGMIGIREESNHWSKPDGSHGCTVHYRRRHAA